MSSLSGSTRAARRPGPQLELDPATVRTARRLARKAGAPDRHAGAHPHDGVRRARRAAPGRSRPAPTPSGIPWVNRLVDAVRGRASASSTASRCRSGTRCGAARHADLLTLAQKAASRAASASACPRAATRSGAAGGRPAAVAGRHPAHRPATGASASGWSPRLGDPPRRPWIYLIVATGDIYEDIPQAQAAAREGADVIAVIRSTGQSLLDYVPEGATREGYAGTYATQENFRLMRAALDDVVARSSAATCG